MGAILLLFLLVALLFCGYMWSASMEDRFRHRPSRDLEEGVRLHREVLAADDVLPTLGSTLRKKIERYVARHDRTYRP